MAETFPDLIGKMAVNIVSGMKYGRDKGGMLVSTRDMDSYWAGKFTSGKLLQDEYADLDAWLTDCVELNKRVDFIHPRFRVPRSYTLDNLPFGGAANVVAIPDLRHVVLSGLPLGLILKRGDRFTLVQDDLRCYRKVAEDILVDSSIAQSVRLTPRLPMGVFAAGCTALFKNPPLRLAIVPDSWTTEEWYQASALSFEATEALR
ncbi:hypothetical protein [Devosia sp. DBB001]|nr:hypothetical protein [Devosia sp. DBB001]